MTNLSGNGTKKRKESGNKALCSGLTASTKGKASQQECRKSAGNCYTAFEIDHVGCSDLCEMYHPPSIPGVESNQPTNITSSIGATSVIVSNVSFIFSSLVWSYQPADLRVPCVTITPPPCSQLDDNQPQWQSGYREQPMVFRFHNIQLSYPS